MAVRTSRKTPQKAHKKTKRFSVEELRESIEKCADGEVRGVINLTIRTYKNVSYEVLARAVATARRHLVDSPLFPRPLPTSDSDHKRAQRERGRTILYAERLKQVLERLAVVSDLPDEARSKIAEILMREHVGRV